MAKTTKYIMESVPGSETVISGQSYLYFGGTGYYELQGHSALINAGIETWKKSGTNAAAGRNGMGSTAIHLKTEEVAAKFFGTEDASYIASGYLSNTAGLQALYSVQAFDLIFIDQYAHFCVVDAARSTGAEIHTFAHLSPVDLARQLSTHVKSGQKPAILTDGLFPGHGSIAPLPRYLELAELWDGVIWVDDAHGAGVLGRRGRGTEEYFKLNSDRIYSGTTMSKAFGGFGGLLRGSREFMENVQTGNVMHGACPPPLPIAAATIKGIELVSANPQWREALWRNARLLKDGLRALGFDVEQSEIPITTFSVGSAERNQQIFEQLIQRKIAIQNTSYPGIATGGTLRMVVFSTHTTEQINYFLTELGSIL